MRSDYAMAVYDPKFPRVLRFSGGRYKPNSALPSTTPAPLARSVTSYPSHAAPEERKTPLSTPYATTPVRTSNQPSSSRPNGIAIFLAIAALLVAAFTKGKWGRQQKVSSLPPPLPANVPEPSSFNEKLTLDSLTWEQFELLIGLIYQRQGWEVAISGGLGPDGGIDVTLTRGSEKVLVQCKHRKDPVKVEEIRELFGVHMAERSTRAIFITSGEYTKPGLQFAEGKDIEMINRTQLLRLIGEVTRPGENLFRVNQWVKQFEEEVNIFTPTCPRCSATMSLKSGPGWRRWYCSRPRCRGDRKARADLHYHMVLE